MQIKQRKHKSNKRRHNHKTTDVIAIKIHRERNGPTCARRVVTYSIRLKLEKDSVREKTRSMFFENINFLRKQKSYCNSPSR